MWADVRAAFAFLTILPLGHSESRKPGWSFAWYPLVGLAIGAALALTGAVAPFAAAVNAHITLAVWVILTGGLHLDGFGDACDGLFAAAEPTRRLEIMKDPRTGSWAVIGLILLLLGKWSALATLSPPLTHRAIWLILPPVVGRWAMVSAAYVYPYARQSGLGGYFRDGLGREQVITATGTALGAVIALTVIARDLAPALIAGGSAALTVLVAGRWAARRLGGGLTGDVYGALCELTELLCLLGLGAWASG